MEIKEVLLFKLYSTNAKNDLFLIEKGLKRKND